MACYETILIILIFLHLSLVMSSCVCWHVAAPYRYCPIDAGIQEHTSSRARAECRHNLALRGLGVGHWVGRNAEDAGEVRLRKSERALLMLWKYSASHVQSMPGLVSAREPKRPQEPCRPECAAGIVIGPGEIL